MKNIPPSETNAAARGPNRLAGQKSPYLLQHAHNPVDWYPWGQEAFDRAERENKPVFLSIGYSTCHWCHVMEKESFEDDEVAALMNRAFVSVKVDREERPDVDSIYMTACQMLTGSGGWPLTVIMTPDKKPFFAGTYFPRESRFGRIGMRDLIPRVQKMWETDHARIVTLSEEITGHLRQEDGRTQPDEPAESVLHDAFEQLKQLFDKQNGGFSSAPKFPTPHMLLFLLRHLKRTGDREALHMVTRTLDAMRDGGVYDHAGFGFHRYSTDAHWLVPHFEKMLYDQAMLCMAYTEAGQETGDQRYRKTAEEIIAYVLRDMTAHEGAFFSAEDADSEGEEGKFYVWSHDEIISTLEPDDAEIICSTFDIRRKGNFVDPVTGERPGTNILHKGKPIPEIAAEKNLSVQELEDRLEKSLARLLAARRKRIPPHKDDKVLTDWNGLMIAALAKAAQAFQKQEYAHAAEKAAGFIMARLRRSDGRLLHRYRDGDASLPAHLDDYAFLVAGLIELYEATLDPRHLHDALSLNALMIKHFRDGSGGFFFTADDGEDLLVRKKEIHDAAIPSGNSVALMNLVRLARMTGDAGLEEKAVQAARSFFSSVRQALSAHAYFLCALDYLFGPSHEVVISGRQDATDTREMLRALQTSFLPRVSFMLNPAGTEDTGTKPIAAFIPQQPAPGDRATAYVCSEQRCLPPTTDLHALLAMLRTEAHL